MSKENDFNLSQGDFEQEKHSDYSKETKDFLKLQQEKQNDILLHGSHIISEKSLLTYESTKRQNNLVLLLYKLNKNNKVDQKIMKMIKDAEKLMQNSQLNSTRLRQIDSSIESSIKFSQDFDLIRKSEAINHNFLNQNYEDLQLQLNQFSQWISKVQDNSAGSAISLIQNSAVPRNFLQGSLLCTFYQKLVEMKQENTMKLVIFNLTGVDYKDNIEYLIGNYQRNGGLKYVTFMPFDDNEIQNYSKIKTFSSVTVIPYQRNDLDQFQLNFFYENFLKQELMYIPRQSVIVILLSSTQNYCLPALQTIIRKTVVNKQHVFVHIDALIQNQNKNSMDIEEDNGLTTNKVFQLINVSYSAFANLKTYKSPTIKLFKYEKWWIENTLSYIFDNMNLTISQRELLEGQRYQQFITNKSNQSIKQSNSHITKQIKVFFVKDDGGIDSTQINGQPNQTYVDYEDKLIVGYSNNQIFYQSFFNNENTQSSEINEKDGIITNPTILKIKQYIIVAFGVNCETNQFIPYIYVIDSITNTQIKCNYQQVLQGNLIQSTEEKKSKNNQKQFYQRYQSDNASQIIGLNYANEEDWKKKIKNRRNPGVSKVVLFKKQICDQENTLSFMLIGGESEKSEIMNIVECIYLNLETKTFESYIIEKSSIFHYKNTLYPIYPESSQKILIEQISLQQEAIIILPGIQTLDYKFNCPLNNQQQNRALVYKIDSEKGVQIQSYQLNYNDKTGHEDLRNLYAISETLSNLIKWIPNRDCHNIKKITKNDDKIYWVMLNNFFIYNQNLQKAEVLQQNQEKQLISISELFDRLLITILHVDHEKQQIDITFRIKDNNKKYSLYPRVIDPKDLDRLQSQYLEESTRASSNIVSIIQTNNQIKNESHSALKDIDLLLMNC